MAPSPPDDDAPPRKGTHPLVTVVLLLSALIGLGKACGHKLWGKGLGQHCTAANDCRSGSCLMEGLFSGACTDDCSRDSDCGELRCDGRHCVRKATSELGKPCTRNSDCPGLLCLHPDRTAAMLANEGVCSQACGTDSPCPADYLCAPLDTGQTVCVADELHREEAVQPPPDAGAP